MLKKAAMLFGVVFILIGILGFIPGITTSDNLLLGLFKVDALHNIVHLVSGIAALAAAMYTESGAKTYFQVFGVVYALVAILGFVYMDDSILGFLVNNMADTLLHTVIALASLYLGFAVKEEATV